jgi:hypothetical protein
MKLARTITLLLFALASAARGAEDYLDRVDEALTFSALADRVRARLSGTLDLEGYHLQQPAPGLIYTERDYLFNPRLSLFLDAQLGPQVYAFVQARADRGFDPSDEGSQVRLDEYAVRFTARGSAHFQAQAGKFATIVGNWVPRHDSWQNPFVTAPLPYENLTGIWDRFAARSSDQLLAWAHVKSTPPHGDEYVEKPLRTPIIWGPSYASGVALFGRIGKLDAAFEFKNTSLSSHPETWAPGRVQWQNPTFSGRLGYRPNTMWNLGFSVSSGTYLRPDAEPTIAPGFHLADYRQTVLAHDISFAWHHWQVWAEFYAARFVVPKVAYADTLAYYTEVKYKFTPRFFGALRWNQQVFGRIPDGRGGRTAWGRDTWRIDFSAGYRFTPHTQLKIEYNFRYEGTGAHDYSSLLATQFVLRF